jgi:hypothetical protein
MLSLERNLHRKGMIENTEATIKTGLIKVGSPLLERAMMEATITKLSGIVGERFIKLYHENPQFYFGLSFVCKYNLNLLEVLTNYPMCPLDSGDEITLLFDDGERMKFFTLIKSYKIGKDKRSAASLSDEQLIALVNKRMTKLVVNSAKYSMNSEFTFYPNDQYESSQQGQKLLSIMAERISGAKLLIVNSV